MHPTLDQGYEFLPVFTSKLPPQLNISGGPKTVAQLLVGHNFKTASKNFTKLHTTFFAACFQLLCEFLKQMDNKM